MGLHSHAKLCKGLEHMKVAFAHLGVGDGVGALDGCPVGRTVGVTVGRGVGASDGSSVGLEVGSSVGLKAFRGVSRKHILPYIASPLNREQQLGQNVPESEQP